MLHSGADRVSHVARFRDASDPLPRYWTCHLRTGVIAAGLTLLGVASPAFADSIHDDTLARSVPASAGFFVELDHLIVDEQTSRARIANRLYELLVGPDEARQGVSLDWQRTIRALGIKRGRAAKELLARRVAIAAPSWQRLAEGIILVRLHTADKTIQQEVFPPDNIDTIDGKADVTVYRSRNVLSVANQRQTLIVSQKHTTDSLYQQAVDLMLDPSKPSLVDDPRFRKAFRALPDALDGLAYLDGLGGGSAQTDQTPRTISLGMHLGDDGVRCTFFSTRSAPNDAGRRQPVPLDRVGLLPQTTLGAWSTELNVRDAFQGAIRQGMSERAPAFVKLLAEVFDVETVVDEFIAKLGPRVIVTWDQHLSTGPDVPQIAVLVEAEDAALSAKTCAEAVQVVVDWLDLQARSAPDRRVKLAQSAYLGITLYEVTLPMPAGAADDLTDTNLAPAFAAVDGWFVLATSADQIRNMIDARWGLTPSLKDLPDVAALADLDAPPIMLAVGQPALAAQVVDAWLNQASGPAGRWLAGLMGHDRELASPNPVNPKLGIGMTPGTQPGTVLVARVYPTGRAYGQLRPGDHILGVNDRLLSLARPTADLRRIVSRSPESGQWAFRVLRDERTLDVVVPAGTPRRISQTAADPAGALRQLQSLLHMIEFASFRVTDNSPTQVRGHLTLRFTPDRPSP